MQSDIAEIASKVTYQEKLITDVTDKATTTEKNLLEACANIVNKFATLEQCTNYEHTLEQYSNVLQSLITVVADTNARLIEQKAAPDARQVPHDQDDQFQTAAGNPWARAQQADSARSQSPFTSQQVLALPLPRQQLAPIQLYHLDSPLPRHVVPAPVRPCQEYPVLQNKIGMQLMDLKLFLLPKLRSSLPS